MRARATVRESESKFVYVCVSELVREIENARERERDSNTEIDSERVREGEGERECV